MRAFIIPVVAVFFAGTSAFAAHKADACKMMPDDITHAATSKPASKDTKEALSLRDSGVALCEAGNAHDAKEKFAAAYKLLGVDPNLVASSR